MAKPYRHRANVSQANEEKPTERNMTISPWFVLNPTTLAWSGRSALAAPAARKWLDRRKYVGIG
jgi:hypothetical protein